MTTSELCDYYAKLLIMQYKGKPKAFDTVRASAVALSMLQTSEQTVTLSAVPSSGEVVFGYGPDDSTAIPFNASTADIQTALRTISTLALVTVTGRLVTGSFTVKFVGIDPPARELLVVSNTLLTVSNEPIGIEIEETDVTLPIAVMNGYNLSGSALAVGKQLDVLAKYVGVGRIGVGPSGEFALDDAELLQLIYIAIDRNRLKSRFSDMAAFFHKWFPSQVLLTDNFDMTIDMAVSVTLYPEPLWQAFLAFNLVPRPQGVEINSLEAPPTVDGFFGYRTYLAPNPAVKPYNTYADYNPAWKYLTYDDV